jgi:hypothetical protein
MVSVFDWSVIDHGLQKNCIGGVMVSVLEWSVIDHGLQKNCIGGVMVSDSFSVTHDLSHSNRVH